MGKSTSETMRKNKLLKQGQISIVAQLCDLPSTTHDYNSFIVDVDHSSEILRSFVVEGVFKETDSKSDRPPIRAFSRRFITVPQGAGMNIINDMLTITPTLGKAIRSVYPRVCGERCLCPPNRQQAMSSQRTPSYCAAFKK